MRPPSWLARLLPHRNQRPVRRPQPLELEVLSDRTTPAVGFGGAFAIGNGGEWARDVAADAVGNTYVSGIFNGVVNFDPTGANPDTVLTSTLVPNPDNPTGFSYRQDVFVAKYDSLGACVWAVRLDGSAEGLAVTADGGAVLATGGFSGVGRFGSETTLTSVGDQDAVVVRLDGATGAVQWARQWGGAYGHDSGSDVAFDADGNAYSTGRINLTSGGLNNNMDVFVVKYDAAGTELWSRQAGGSLGDAGSAIAIDPAGSVLVGGNFRGTMDFDPGAGTYSLTSGGRSVDPSTAGFVMKLTAGGSFVWASHFQANQWSSSSVADIAVDGAGRVYAAGNYEGTVDFNPDKKAAAKLTGSSDGFAVQLDPQGRLSWVKAFGGDSNFDVYAATVDAGGNLYVTGSFRGTVDLDPGSGVFSRTSAGDEDGFVMKLNTTGGFVWGASVGGAGIDRSQGIAVDSSGNVFVTGLFAGPADYNPDPATEYLLEGGYYTAFYLRLTQT